MEKSLTDYPSVWREIPEYRIAIENLERSGYIRDCKLTDKGLQVLEKHRVKNAIIMAAGFSARCMPLSQVMPKGLFRVKDEILLEREIEQLKEAGIDEIVVVTGFLSEKFDYLKDKYGVILINNPDYDKYNNMSSLYAARDYIDCSYILCSDNYYEENVFHRYVYCSYYSCVYSEGFCDEF
ncbi:MAG: NTP transferase domain-containing protein, partial [Eubacterium sp.]|nr:NTP transferase domain-containing protein [Eubacterium sp.]